MERKPANRLQPIVALPCDTKNGFVFGIGPERYAYVAIHLARDCVRLLGLVPGTETVFLDQVLDMPDFYVGHVQPLPDGILLINPTSHPTGRNQGANNARVYRNDGALLRSFCLGDDVWFAQTSHTGTLWTGYTERGIYGRQGWTEPIGASGLLAWDAQGQQCYAYPPYSGGGHFGCCYALNVASNRDTWCFYYPAFTLVHLRDFQIDDYWSIPKCYPGALAVRGRQVLFASSSYSLWTLNPNGTATLEAEERFWDEHGEPLIPDGMVGRGDTLYLLRGHQLYALSVRDVTQ